MNPLEWKSEHQIALLICAGIGFIIGLFVGLREVSAYGFEFLWSFDRYNDHSINLYWVAVGMVGMIGAIIGAAIIYTVQMMRR